ncbi:CARDB domain-containing protein, partial [Candidatus Altiarchaeota archaeon]
ELAQAVEFEKILRVRPETTLFTVQTITNQISGSYLIRDMSSDIILVDINIQYLEGGDNPLNVTKVSINPSHIISLDVLEETRVNLTIADIDMQGNYTGELLVTGKTASLNEVTNTTIPIEIYVSDDNASLYIYQSEIVFSSILQNGTYQQTIETKNEDPTYEVDYINFSFTNLTSQNNTLDSNNFNVSAPDSIPPGEIGETQVVLSIPLNQKPGTYNGTATLTISFNDTLDTTFDYGLTTLIDIPSSDLAIQYLETNPTQIGLEDEVSLIAWIKNVGLGRTEGGFSTSFYINESLANSTQSSYLDPGDTRSVSSLWQSPSYEGSYLLEAYVDSNQNISEAGENNNNRTLDLEITGIETTNITLYSGWSLISIPYEIS